MSIAYAEPDMTGSDGSFLSFKVAPRPVATFAVSALLIAVAAGSTTSGVPLREAAPVIRPADTQIPERLPESVAGATLSDAELIKSLKLESGLTWDQIARTFDVSRRSIHLWATGGRISAGNAEALQSFAALVRAVGGSTPEETRNSLLTLGPDNHSPLDRFRRERHALSRAVGGPAFDAAALLGASSNDSE